MKQSFLFTLSFFLLFDGPSILAQTNAGNYTPQQLLQKQHAGVLSTIENLQTARLNAAQARTAKTTGPSAERLVAFSGYDIAYGNGLTDSMRYVYSGNRSSTFDYNSVSYPGTFYRWDGFCPARVVSSDAVYYQNNMPAVLCDSSTYNHYSTTASEWNYEQQTATVYDANNNVIDYYSPFLTNPIPDYISNRVINSYDAGQHLTSSVIFNWDNGVWDTSRKREYAYNGNKIIMDSSSIYINGAWQPQARWSYVYDNAGNIIQATGYQDTTGAWHPMQQYFFSFNAENRVVGDSMSLCPYGTWMPFIKDSIGYTAGVNYVTYEKETEYGEYIGIEDMYFIVAKHIAPSGLTDSTYNFLYSLYNNAIMQASNIYYEYNSNNDLETENHYYFHDTAGNSGYYSTSPDFIRHYYYQRYNTAVNNVTQQQVNVTIYPNPATNEINIAQTGIQQGALTYITLYNALGQTMHSESLPWMSNSATISIANLKAGDYWLVIQDKNGSILSRQTIVKE